jgi:8-oxo-dGTP pyrophosphatase MutT (NUDIX family)
VTVTELGVGAQVGGLPDFVEWQETASLLLTRRSANLRHHPGQWAFPGGRCDPGESAEQTALREMWEEVGLEPSKMQVLGLLDDFVTHSGFVMTPVVVWGGRAEPLVLSTAEVASTHRIPMSEWLREDAPQLTPAPDSEHPILRMPVGNDHIAAPTAAILYQFRELCLLGRSTPVHHFEQPLFARR